MTNQELSKAYKLHAMALSIRIGQLEAMKDGAHLLRKEQIEERIKMLSVMRDEANELASLTAKGELLKHQGNVDTR